MSSKKAPNSFVFSIIMCVVFGFLLTAASVGLKSRQETNVLVDKQKNILKALGLLNPGQKYKTQDIISLYQNKVKNYYLNQSGELVQTKTDLPIFVVGDVTQIDAYAIPLKAYGLWSWIYGYIALKGDGDTLVGFTVYKHGETPGLGGECEKPWFENQFVGKKIANNDGQFVSIGIVKGEVSEKIQPSQQSHYVDGISGATITSKGIQKYIKIDLEKYEAFSKRLRG